MSPIALILHAALLCAGVGGLLLLVRGLRGHRVGDHPHCRACNYDLVGAATASAPHAARIGPAPGTGPCPECGADLAKISAVRIGEHRRRPRLVVGGLVLLLLAGIVGGAEAWSAGRNFNPNPYKPVWFLLWEARRGSAPKTALAEIEARLTNKTLSPGQAQQVTRDALALQGDSSRAWLTEWGDLMEHAHAMGMVSLEDWRTYARQGIRLSLRLRPRMRRGDAFPVMIQTGPNRAGSGGWSYLWPVPWVTVNIPPLEVDGRSALRPGRNGSGGSMRMPLSGGGGLSGTTAEWADLADPAPADGEHEWSMAVAVEVSDGPSEGPAFLKLSIPLKARATIVPVSEATVRPIHDDTLRASIEKSLRVTEAAMQGNPHYLSLMINAKSSPVPLAFDVWVHQGERRWRLSAIQVSASVNGFYGAGGDVSGLAGDRVDVILRPSADAASRSIDLTQYWDGEVVLKNVVIKGVMPVATTTTTAPTGGGVAH